MTEGIVNFKLKSSIFFDTVRFNGSFISVGELKGLIAEKKGLGKDASAELILSKPKTNEEYSNDSELIPRNSSVLVRRAPAVRHKVLQGSTDGQAAPEAQAAPVVQARAATGHPLPSSLPPPDRPPEDEFGGNPYAKAAAESTQPAGAGAGASDEDTALTNMLQQRGAEWRREVGAAGGRGRGRGGRGRGRFGVPPPHYVCFRCQQGGHFISDCPTNGDPDFDRKRIRAPVGIPVTRLVRNEEGGLVLPNGEVGSLMPNEQAFHAELASMPGGLPPPLAQPQPAQAAAEPVGVQPPPRLPPPNQPLQLDSKPHAGDDGVEVIAPSQPTLPPAAPAAPQSAAASASVRAWKNSASPANLAAPQFAGDDEFFQALAEAPPALPLGGGPGLPMPALPLPGLGAAAGGAKAWEMPLPPALPRDIMPRGPAHMVLEAFGEQPLSADEFERLRLAATRKAARRRHSRSYSRSRSPSRRRDPEGRSRRRRHGSSSERSEGGERHGNERRRSRHHARSPGRRPATSEERQGSSARSERPPTRGGELSQAPPQHGPATISQACRGASAAATAHGNGVSLAHGLRPVAAAPPRPRAVPVRLPASQAAAAVSEFRYQPGSDRWEDPSPSEPLLEPMEEDEGRGATAPASAPCGEAVSWTQAASPVDRPALEPGKPRDDSVRELGGTLEARGRDSPVADAVTAVAADDGEERAHKKHKKHKHKGRERDRPKKDKHKARVRGRDEGSAAGDESRLDASDVGPLPVPAIEGAEAAHAPGVHAVVANPCIIPTGGAARPLTRRDSLFTRALAAATGPAQGSANARSAGGAVKRVRHI